MPWKANAINIELEAGNWNTYFFPNVDWDTLVLENATQTLTNKTIDVDNNPVSNIEVDNFKASAIVIESEWIAANDNDTTIPTSAAVKDYVDTSIWGAWSTWTPTVSGTSWAVTSYSEQIWRYVVIWKTVHFTCRVRVSNKGTLAWPVRLHIPHTMVSIWFEIPFASSYMWSPSNNFFTWMKWYWIHTGANDYIQFQTLFWWTLTQRSSFSNNDFIAVSWTYEIA